MSLRLMESSNSEIFFCTDGHLLGNFIAQGQRNFNLRFGGASDIFARKNFLRSGGMGKSITLFLIDDKADGRIKCTIHSRSGVIFRIPRRNLPESKEFKQRVVRVKKSKIQYNWIG